VDDNEPYATSGCVECVLGFHPHRIAHAPQNLSLVRKAARGCDLIYVPTNLKSLAYAQVVRLPVVAGPNITPIFRKNDSPGSIELTMMCDLWIEASEMRTRHVLKTTKGRFAENIMTIHHAIDSEKFSPDRRRAGFWESLCLSSRTVKVLFVGRDNEPRKGVRQLLDAVGIVNRQENVFPVDFVIVGKMSEDTCEALAGTSNAHRLGFKKGRELADIYANSDISVVPSSWENFPFSVMEAMASGLAVIASRVGGIPEQITGGETGILLDIVANTRSVHRGDAGEILAGAICDLIDDPQRRLHLGRKARTRVLEYFNEERLGAELCEAFTRVLARKELAK
jgi:glycosyltransferase involved in cell wall biosynthesis